MQRKRQTLVFTATWSKEVDVLSSELCNNYPVKLRIGASDLSINKDIAQTIEITNDYNKKRRLIDVLRSLARSPKDKC